DPPQMVLAPSCHTHSAAVTKTIEHLDSGNRPRTKKRPHRRPVVGRTETELKTQGIGDRHHSIIRVPTQLSRLQAISLPEERIEAPQAPKTARECCFGNR